MQLDNVELVVHPDTKDALATFCKKPSHAVLLLGNPGTGKRTLSRALASDLLGLGSVSVETAPYVHIISPAQGSIAIAAIRDIRSFLKLRVPTPGNGAFNRAIIVEEAQAMTRESQNALLKLLEEPPEHTIIICTASQLERILPTVRSRLQKIRVRQPSMQEVVSFFAQKGIPHETVERAMMMHDGNIAAASQEMLHGTEPNPQLSAVKQALQATAFERLAMVDTLSKQKSDANAFVEALLIAAGASLRKAAASADTSKLLRWGKVIEAAKTAERALEHNANTKIVLTELMLSL